MTPEEKTKSTAEYVTSNNGVHYSLSLSLSLSPSDRPLYLCIQAPNQSFINGIIIIMYTLSYFISLQLLCRR